MTEITAILLIMIGASLGGLVAMILALAADARRRAKLAAQLAEGVKTAQDVSKEMEAIRIDFRVLTDKVAAMSMKQR